MKFLILSFYFICIIGPLVAAVILSLTLTVLLFRTVIEGLVNFSKDKLAFEMPLAIQDVCRRLEYTI